jgi:hypothetical protein
VTDAQIEGFQIGMHPRLTTGAATHPVLNATVNTGERAQLTNKDDESQAKLYSVSPLRAS